MLTSDITFLKGMLVWAAHNPEQSAWDDFRDEMRIALRNAKRIAGLLPRFMPAPCAHCGGPAVRTWADRNLTPHPDGLADIVICQRCKRTWPSEAQYRQLSKTHVRVIPETLPEMHVTAAEAMTIWPHVPTGTWRTWAGRDQMPEIVGWDVRGVPLYVVRDLAELIERRADTQRRGRKSGA